MAELSSISGDRMEWMGDGACLGEDAELFFPDDEIKGAERMRQIKAAKAVCTRCSVLDKCRAWALGSVQRYGVWGATSQSERERIWREHDNDVTRSEGTPDESVIQLLVSGAPVPGAARIDVAHAAVRLVALGQSQGAAGRQLGVDRTQIWAWVRRSTRGEPLLSPAWLARQRRIADQLAVAS